MKRIISILGIQLCNSLNSNQQEQSVFKGMRDLSVSMGGKIVTGVISANQATALVPGQRVKLDTTAGVGAPSFVAAAITEVAFGVIGYQSNLASFSKGTPVDVLTLGSVYYAAAGNGAIAAGALVEGYAGQCVVTYAASTQKKHGVAIDAAAATGDLIRVMVGEPIIA